MSARTGVVHQYQEELPVTRVVVRQFEVHVGRCDRCGIASKGDIPCKPPTRSALPPRN